MAELLHANTGHHVSSGITAHDEAENLAFDTISIEHLTVSSVSNKTHIKMTRRFNVAA
ncbi:MAG: hypothetical protein P8X89_15355 [Reinekea sp.]|jgi:hypothetical protein